MRVFISGDIEGITGLVSWSQCSRPDGKSFDYPFARRMYSHDINAAIRGARAAGATDIVVKDSHGNSKNLLIEDLEPGVSLISGMGFGGEDGMMHGIDESFDAAVLVGYHAMAGTTKGVMEHTITGGIHRLKLNQKEVGEIGLSCAAAARYGVPVVAISSDRAGVGEAVSLLPAVQSFAVKKGLGRYSATLLPLSETGPGIERAVSEGVRKAQRMAPFYEGEVELSIEFNRGEEADMCQRHPPMQRIDGYTVAGTFPGFREAHRVLWDLVELSFMGIGSQH